jgi:hypothetical protein
MHSCGKINAIIEGLIEAGLEVINSSQPRALGIEEIGQQFCGRICFESVCDIQNTLPLKGPAEIRREAQSLLEHWAAPDGGFIILFCGEGKAIGTEEQRWQIMLDSFLEADPWQ